MNPYLQRASDAIDAATRGLSREQLTRHPQGKWCAAEILEHLCRAYRTSVPHLQKCLDAGRPLGGRANLKHRLAVAVVTGFRHMPEGRKAPEFTLPKGVPPEQTMREIPEHLAALDRVLGECERRFGRRAKIADHPILGPMCVNQWRKFHWVHTRHHMKQIARLRDS
jgi:hypothetical protein